MKGKRTIPTQQWEEKNKEPPNESKKKAGGDRIVSGK